MKANKQVSQYLESQAEKVSLDAWDLVDRFDRGENINPASVAKIKERAALVLSNAQTKAEEKRLNKIMASALYNLKSVA